MKRPEVTTFFVVVIAAGFLVATLTGFVTFLDNAIFIDVEDQGEFSHISLGNQEIFLYAPLDVDSSGVTHDFSGNGHDGTTQGNAVFAGSCLYGGCFEFDGNGDYISFPSLNNDPVFANSFSFSAWVRNDVDVTGAVNDIAGTEGRSNRNNNPGWYLSINRQEKVQFAVSDGTSGEAANNQNNVGIGEWHHVVAVYDKSVPSLQVYIDAVPGNLATATAPANGGQVAQDLGIGRAENNNRGWDGAIDEVMLFDKALSESEITEIFSDQFSKFLSVGEKIYEGVNVAALGYVDTVDLEMAELLNFPGVEFTVQVGDSDGAGGYVYGSEFNFVDGMVTGIPISTPEDISVKVIFHADPALFYTPLMMGEIAISDLVGGGFCGDEIVDPGEDCDGNNLGGETCESQGYDSGTLLCNVDCTFDTSMCVGAADPVIGILGNLVNGGNTETLDVLYQGNSRVARPTGFAFDGIEEIAFDSGRLAGNGFVVPLKGTGQNIGDTNYLFNEGEGMTDTGQSWKADDANTMLYAVNWAGLDLIETRVLQMANLGNDISLLPKDQEVTLTVQYLEGPGQGEFTVTPVEVLGGVIVDSHSGTVINSDAVSYALAWQDIALPPMNDVSLNRSFTLEGTTGDSVVYRVGATRNVAEGISVSEMAIGGWGYPKQADEAVTLASAWAGYVDAFKPDIVIWQYAGNQGLTGVVDATKVLMDRMETANPDVIHLLQIENPSPRSNSQIVIDQSWTWANDVVGYEGAIIIDPTAFLPPEFAANQGTQNLGQYFGNNVHENALGARAVANATWNAIEEYVAANGG